MLVLQECIVLSILLSKFTFNLPIFVLNSLHLQNNLTSLPVATEHVYIITHFLEFDINFFSKWVSLMLIQRFCERISVETEVQKLHMLHFGATFA
jgi:hypothetical protein